MNRKKRNRWILYTGISVVFLAVFYIALFWGTDDWKVKLPVLSDVKPFRFVDQAGDTITQKNLTGKVCVVSFFFTTCPGICPRMEDNLKTQIYDSLKSNPDFLLLSHTVNPETDSVPRLRHYADSIGADPHHWLFLTGGKSEIYESARNSYLLDDQNNSKKKLQEQFIHTQLVALVDRDGRVRGIYDGLSQKELLKLRTDATGLLTEQE